MKVIGITGGIGSGKSTVCRIFSVLDVPVFNADDEAKELYHEKTIREKVMALLGNDSYKEESLNRSAVAKKVFSDKKLLDGLNAIIHPAVQQRFNEWCEKHSSLPYVLKEAAILFESGADKGTDAVITVASPMNLRIERIMKRDNITSGDVEKRMKNQWSQPEKIKRSRFVIVNDESEMLIPQVLKVHRELISV